VASQQCTDMNVPKHKPSTWHKMSTL
jgi:hypothetical protein